MKNLALGHPATNCAIIDKTVLGVALDHGSGCNSSHVGHEGLEVLGHTEIVRS